MGKTKHEKTFVDFDKPYEQNTIGLRGVIYFAVGLFLLIVVTFGLMWAFQNVMEDQAKETKDAKSPMAMNEQEKLPPADQPRLQAAPGFGVDGPNGRINLELKKPSSEYQELRAEWEKEWKDGRQAISQDGKTTTALTLPIDEAKEKLLQQNPKARTGNEAQNALDEARSFISYSSAGRTRTDKRR
ncbi:MAG: hypothetical protein ABJA66_18730 [Actinomycetota bacterium]